MAEFSFSDLFKSDNAGGDIFGNMFGGGGTPTGLDALLTEDQRKLLSQCNTVSSCCTIASQWPKPTAYWSGPSSRLCPASRPRRL
jgi:hypothetical protein